jgi:hypothetical protein
LCQYVETMQGTNDARDRRGAAVIVFDGASPVPPFDLTPAKLVHTFSIS